MSATVEIPDVDELYVVDVRKYDIDATAPWWQRFYFRVIYLPFVRFSFRRLKIPAQGSLDVDGRLNWLEYIGIATDRESANAMCDGEFYRVVTLPVNIALPKQSLQYKGHSYPRSVMPDRYRRRTFPLATAPVHQMAQVRRNLEKVIQSAAPSQ